ncbi:hypothetical protein [Dyella sp.]|uniref:hypothetical protein n=1 Tax=Dyella sp. TaxID=1869338 RepID=UPI002ED1B50F
MHDDLFSRPETGIAAKAPSRAHETMIMMLLAVCMVATRFKHFGDALHVPDASMAVFFLGGLYLRRHVGFAAFMLLAVGIDRFAVSHAGVSDFCVTPAYVMLLPAYAVLWYATRWCGRHRSLWATLVFGLFASALAFALSNGGFYWFGGRYAQPNMGQYLSRLWQWGPLFVRTTMIYLVAALWLQRFVGWLSSIIHRGAPIAAPAVPHENA